MAGVVNDVTERLRALAPSQESAEGSANREIRADLARDDEPGHDTSKINGNDGKTEEICGSAAADTGSAGSGKQLVRPTRGLAYGQPLERVRRLQAIRPGTISLGMDRAGPDRIHDFALQRARASVHGDPGM